MKAINKGWLFSNVLYLIASLALSDDVPLYLAMLYPYFSQANPFQLLFTRTLQSETLISNMTANESIK